MKALEVGNFPCIMKLSNVTPVHKKAMDQRKIIIDLSACCPTYSNSFKDVLTKRCLNTLKE